MSYKSYDTEEMLAKARRIAAIGTFLPRDYARCNGVGFNPNGRGVIECDRRQSCKRFLSYDDVDAKYARYLIPEMTKEKPNCEEYIGDE